MEIHMKICGEAAFVLMNDLSFIRCNIYLFLTQQETAAKPADRDPLAFEIFDISRIYLRCTAALLYHTACIAHSICIRDAVRLPAAALRFTHRYRVQAVLP